jgi:hypothetical protein
MFGTEAAHDMIHNISKNWIQRIYIVWDIADLGFSHFYFSCSKYPESDHVSVTKVVVFFTTSPTKLSLKFSEFSMIFYAFYKFLQTGYTIEVTILHRSSWKTFQIYTQAPGSRKTPWKVMAACNWVLRHGCRWRRPKFRCSGAGIGRGKGGGWLGAHHASVWGFGRGGGAAGDGV